jgi:hypothetical protein
MKATLPTNTPCDADPNFRIETTRCCRCGGLMKPEPVFDLVENEIEFMAARCIQCGELVDPVILRNRSGKGTLSGSTGRPRH